MTNSALLAVLVDSLLPGGPVAKHIALPSASSVGCDRALVQASNKIDSLIAKIEDQAGSADAFIAAGSSARTQLLQSIQTEEPEVFAELVTLILTHYFAQAEVLKSIGWRGEPPQPTGHPLSPFDEALLAPVRARGAIWRST
jgi:hypothetical protein